jgi:Mrp family chromosome partitioning ATPase
VCDRFAPELIAFHEPDHPVSEQYRALLAGIEAQLPAGWPQVLLITAPAPRAGTTTVLLNLALTRSLEKGARVAAVDANLTRPAIADRLGLPVAPGLREILQGSISPQRALRQTGLNSFCALTAGQTSDADSTLLGGDPMRALVRYLRGRFDVVFVDAPCWDGHPELVALASLCDAVYLVLPQTASELPEVKDLVQMIPQQGGRLRGCIFTQR